MENTSNNSQIAMARQEGLVVQELPEEVAIYDLQSHKAHCLNKTAAFIWRNCDGQQTVSELTRLLQKETGVPVNDEVIWYTLGKLDEANLLAEKLALPASDGVSRRRMIRRLGAILVIPAVISLVAPTARAAATIVTTQSKIANGQCGPSLPLSTPSCLNTSCCTGAGRVCVQTGPNSAACVGDPCVAAGNASSC